MISRAMRVDSGIGGRIGGSDPHWDVRGAQALGAAYVGLCGLQGQTVVVGHDLRPRGRELAAALARGATGAGADVVDVGLASLDQTSYTAGVLEVPGVHVGLGDAGAPFNGLQFLGTVRPVVEERRAIVERAVRLDESSTSGRTASRRRSAAPGTTSSDDTRADYINHLRGLVCPDGLRPLTVVLDAGHGVAAHLAPPLLRLPGLRLVRVSHPLDDRHGGGLGAGRVQQARRAVLDHGADLAIVLDPEGSRCVVLDDRGGQLGQASLAALLAPVLLERRSGPVVVDSLVADDVGGVVLGSGCVLHVSPVGEGAMSRAMTAHDAVLGVEHDGHWHLREVFGASSGLLVALAAVTLVGRQPEALSVLARRLGRSSCGDEMTLSALDPAGVLGDVAHAFRHHVLSCERGDGPGLASAGLAGPGFAGVVLRGVVGGRGRWWASLVQEADRDDLRLLVEADDPVVLAAVRDDLCSIVREHHVVAA